MADQEEAASDVASPRNGKRPPPPHGNYDKWRGGDKFSGEMKAVLAAQIVARIRDVGITTPRKPKDIISKIGQLEQSYMDATDFVNHTGAGITDERSLRHAIEKRCPHYDALSEVLRDRPSVRPLLTNEDQAFGASDLDAAGDSDAGADTLETADQTAHSQKHSSTSTSTSYRAIRSRRASIASTSSEWSELSSALTRVRTSEMTANRAMHDEHLALKSQHFRESQALKERRFACGEEEMRSRAQLMQAQARKEEMIARREEMQLKSCPSDLRLDE
ncbi:hypothetical protein PybrP1_002360 [[Pythium] brassicae (nom. inval.)]|nr:hypothetical protein PybrP1_002360 [[Pythium] brassicae (nom. inval.)]